MNRESFSRVPICPIAVNCQFLDRKRRFLAFVFVKTTFSVVLESGPSIFDLSKLYVFSCRQAITELTNNSAVWGRRVSVHTDGFFEF